MNTQELMFTLIKSELFGIEPTQDVAALIDAEELERLYRLSKSHDLCHVVAAALEALPLGVDTADPYLQKFQKQQMIAIYRYQTATYELGSICDLFESNAILFIPLKGSVLRQYYPQPWMRTSCDLDIMVRRDDLDRATKLLVTSLGYRAENKNFHNVSLFTQSGVHIELHFDLIEEMRHPAFAKILSTAWEDASPLDGKQYQMGFSNEFFYFYHIAHMVKHFEEGGCGIRPFIDLLVLNRTLTFSQTLWDMLRQGALLDFESNARTLSEAWFDSGEHTELSRMTEQFILHGGVYGNLENKIAVQQQKKGGRFSYVIKKIFPPYRVLKLQYPVLKKHCYLMPVFVVVRWFRWLFGKNARRTVAELSMNSSISDEKVNSASELCHRLGLS